MAHFFVGVHKPLAAEDFGSAESSESKGILYVFPAFLELHGWVKRFADQPQAVYPVVPYGNVTGIYLSVKAFFCMNFLIQGPGFWI